MREMFSRALMAAALFISLFVLPAFSASPLSGSQYTALSHLYGKGFLNADAACIADAMKQGIPVHLAVATCSADLQVKLGDTSNGLNSGPFGGGLATPQSKWTSERVTNACKGVDPTISNGKGAGGYRPTKGEPTGEFYSPTGDDLFPFQRDQQIQYYREEAAWNNYVADEAHNSAMDHADDAKNIQPKPGETAAETEKRKKEAEDAALRMKILEAEAKAKAQEAEKKAKELEKKKEEEAKKNNNGGGQKLTTEEANCEETMAEARELLKTCKKTGFKAVACLDILAGTRCDPALILVDPDAGFTCSPVADGKEALKSMQERCREVTTPGPNGEDPCATIKPDDNTGFLQARSLGDMCSPKNPQAIVDPETNTCFVGLGKLNFPEQHPTLQEAIGIIRNIYGGPIVVLPQPGPSPFPPKG